MKKDVKNLTQSQLLSQILQSNRENRCLNTELLRFKALCSCYEKYVNLLRQNRNNKNVCATNEEKKLRHQLLVLSNSKKCEIRLSLIKSKDIIRHQLCKSEPKDETNELIDNKLIIKKEISDKKCKLEFDCNANNRNSIRNIKIKQEIKDEDFNSVDEQRGQTKIDNASDLDNDSERVDLNTNKVNSDNNNNCTSVENIESIASEILNQVINECEQNLQTETNTRESDTISDCNGNNGIIRIELDSDSETEIDDCDYAINDKQTKGNKRAKHNVQKPSRFVCCLKDCGREFAGVRALRSHQLRHKEGEFKCNYFKCHKVCHSFALLQQHQKEHSKNENLICSYDGCDKIFSSRYHLTDHYRLIHIYEPKFACNYEGCGMKFKTLMYRRHHELNTHFDLHPEVELLVCKEVGCNYRTKLINSFRHHQYRTHRKDISCQECGFRTHFRWEMKDHLLIHSSKERFTCDWVNCGKSFLNRMRLKKHQSVIHKKKRLKCPHSGCDKSFPLRNSLRNHLNKHEGNRKYACDWEGCGKSYFVEHQLKQHKNIHTREIVYRCKWSGCEKTFITEASRYNHTKTKHMQIEYRCDWPECDYVSKNSDNLRKHKSKHTGEKKFSCDWPDCGYRSANRSNLSTHRKFHLKPN